MKKRKVEEDAPTNAVAHGKVPMGPFGKRPDVVDVTDKRRKKDKPPVVLKRFRAYINT